MEQWAILSPLNSKLSEGDALHSDAAFSIVNPGVQFCTIARRQFCFTDLLAGIASNPN